MKKLLTLDPGVPLASFGEACLLPLDHTGIASCEFGWQYYKYIRAEEKKKRGAARGREGWVSRRVTGSLNVPWRENLAP